MDPWELNDNSGDVSYEDLKQNISFDEEDQGYLEDDNSEHLDKLYQQS